MKRAIASLLLVTCSACSYNTTTVRVRDAARVSVETTEGKPLVPEGSAPAETKVADGDFWRPFQHVEYEIHGVREATGALSLRCDECTQTSFEMLSASGTTAPTWSWRVGIEPSAVRVSYEDTCFEHNGHFCHAQAPVRLSIPMDDVIEVRRRSEPVRLIGYLALGFSLLALGTLGYVAAKDHDAAPFAAVVAIPPLAIGGFGLWQVLAPTKEQVWTPSRDAQ